MIRLNKKLLFAIEAVLDRSGVASSIEMAMPAGGRPRQLPVRLQRLREHILWRRISTRVRQHPSRNRHGTQQTPA